MVFYKILVHSHSGFRWILLVTLLVTIINALVKWLKKSEFTPSDRRISAINMSVAHLQLVIGFVLYFISPKVIFDPTSFKEPMLRFFLIEHMVMMVIAIVLITVGLVSAKRAQVSTIKFKRTFIYNVVALVLILVAIPWPFYNYGTTWF